MKRWTLFVLVAGLALAVSSARALTLVGSSSYGWQAWDGTPWNGDVYWDPVKSSHPEPNLGTIVEGSAYYPGYKATWAKSGNADSNVTFLNGQEWAAIIVEVAGLKDKNYFGVYEVGNPTSWTQLFKGSEGASAKKVFHAPHHFGFYLATGIDANNDGFLSPLEASWVWYTQTSLNTNGESNQHFAFFQAKPLVQGLNAYILAVEDLPWTFDGVVGNTNWGKSDSDYNDFVVYVANIPDASTFALFLSGLPALALLRRRK